jgi:hypothetical protein
LQSKAYFNSDYWKFKSLYDLLAKALVFKKKKYSIKSILFDQKEMRRANKMVIFETGLLKPFCHDGTLNL